MEAYLVAMLVFAGFYALMALGLNVIWGLTGMVNLGLVRNHPPLSAGRSLE